jgi:hypothetical protein
VGAVEGVMGGVGGWMLILVGYQGPVLVGTPPPRTPYSPLPYPPAPPPDSQPLIYFIVMRYKGWYGGC